MENIEKLNESSNLITTENYYSIEDIKDIIPMLDDITYLKLYLRFNESKLTEKETEEINIKIGRLLNNQKKFINEVNEKFNVREDLNIDKN